MAGVTGLIELDRKMTRMRKRVQTKITKAAIRAGLSAASKEIRAEIPSQYKAARKAIGWRFKKNKKKGVMEARVGVAVGKKSAKLREWGRKVEDKRRAAKKKGLGISPMTLHWFVVGTSTNVPIKFDNLASKGMQSGTPLVRAAMKSKLREGIRREAAKQ